MSEPTITAQLIVDIKLNVKSEEILLPSSDLPLSRSSSAPVFQDKWNRRRDYGRERGDHRDGNLVIASSVGRVVVVADDIAVPALSDRNGIGGQSYGRTNERCGRCKRQSRSSRHGGKGYRLCFARQAQFELKKATFSACARR